MYNDYPEIQSDVSNESSRLLQDHRESIQEVVPHSDSAEQSVIGGILLDNQAWDAVSNIVSGEHFYVRANRVIFSTIESMFIDSTRSEAVDLVTLTNKLETSNELEQVGGLEYIVSIIRETPTASNAGAYAELVYDRYLRRELIKTGHDFIAKATNPDGTTTNELIQDAESSVMRIAERQASENTMQSMNPLLRKTLDRLDFLHNSGNQLTGLTSGFDDLDARTGGFQDSDLIILAARPSMGKTTMALNMVENALLAANRPVIVFSLEMPAEQLMNRMIASMGRIDQTKLRDGKLDDDEWPKLSVAVNLLKDKPLFIDDASAISPSEMRSKARRIKREQGDLALIVVDYLQLMQLKGKHGKSRVEEISEISRSLKALAKEMKCPVIALSQLNRGLETRPNKRPINSDLRESGGLEQDADVIMFVYRDEVYNEDSSDKGIAEIIIGKQRNGPIGTSRLGFVGRHSRFENLSTNYIGYDD